MNTASAYLRMSTDKQEYSIDSQLRLIQDYALKNQFHIVKTYIDEGISGRQANKRPAFLQMIEDSKKTIFQFVLIYDSSRFARNLEESLVYKSILKKNNVTLISITEPILDEDSSLITDAILGAMNELYSRKLSKHVKRGMEQKALRGEYLSAPPFGYRRPLPLKPLVIEPKEAKAVQYVFQSYLEGKGAYQLAKELNEKGFQTIRGNKIDSRGVSYILKNVTYKGYLCWHCNGGEIYKKADHEAIISEALFEAVEQKRKKNSSSAIPRQKPYEMHKHWLSGFLHCIDCKGTYVFNQGNSHQNSRFRCGNYAKGLCKNSASLPVDFITQSTIEELKKILPYKEKKYYIKNNCAPTQSNTINTQIAKINQKQHRAKEAYLCGADTLEEYIKNKTKIKSELDILIHTKNNITSDTISMVYFTNVISLLEDESFTIACKQSILKKLIKEITIDGKNKTIQIHFYL